MQYDTAIQIKIYKLAQKKFVEIAHFRLNFHQQNH
jgi:hypothetical protein